MGRSGADPDRPTPVVIDVDVARSSRAGRRSVAVAAAVVVVVLVLVVASIVVNRRDTDPVSVVDSGAPTTASSTATSAGSASGVLPEVQPMSALGGTESDMAPDSEVWADHGTVALPVTYNTPEVRLVNPASGEVTSTTRLSVGLDLNTAITKNAVWVANAGSPVGGPGTLQRIDPRSGAIAATLSIPDGLLAGQGVGAADDGVWYLTKGSRPKLVRVDDATDAVSATLDAPDKAIAVGTGSGSLWVGSTDGTLRRLDPPTGAVLATVAVPLDQIFQIKIDGDQVWLFGVDHQGHDVVAHVDGKTAALVAVVVVGDHEDFSGGSIFDVGGGYVWVPTMQAQLVKVDAATDEVVGRFGPTTSAGAAAFDAGVLWVASYGAVELYRVSLA
jgi:hypothetical protein